MAYYAEEEEFYQVEVEEPCENHMEERLVLALDHHVQVSVNQALIKALKPFTQPLVHFGQRELMGRPSDDRITDNPDVNRTQRVPRGLRSLTEILSQMASSILRDHEYEQDITSTSRGLLWQGLLHPEDSQSSASNSSDSEKMRDKPKISGKQKRKTHHSTEESMVQKNFLFEPESIDHPRSTESVPSVEVAHYVQDRLCKSFDKDKNAPALP
ncbi:hypothetical protein NDU88_003170 [Pleurodeles waltl]|uniref:Uncharacterized protein n=1 Tax=Pleurodeles waltl TaxID=8319 RepID=A0AAV7WRL1_PLEWA|nr:hypothetical protein NDU88_003170 [Pleurodeles waltl]